MDLCWRITGISGTEKAVLMSLADQADETGLCWPSVALTAERTCFSDRAVQKSIQSLAAKGLLTVQVSPGGKSNKYTINPEPRSPLAVTDKTSYGEPHSPLNGEPRSPRTTFTPNHVHRNGEPRSPNGEPRSPKPSRTQKNHQLIVPRPDGVDEKLWRDFIALRDKKKAPLSETAWAGIVRESEKAGMSLPEVLATCCERGWQAFKADWVADKKTGTVLRFDPRAQAEQRAGALGLSARPGESWDEFSRRVSAAAGAHA